MFRLGLFGSGMFSGSVIFTLIELGQYGYAFGATVGCVLMIFGFSGGRKV